MDRERKLCKYLSFLLLLNGLCAKKMMQIFRSFHSEPQTAVQRRTQPISESTSSNRSVAVQLARIGATPPVAVGARRRLAQAREMVGCWRL